MATFRIIGDAVFGYFLVLRREEEAVTPRSEIAAAARLFAFASIAAVTAEI